MLLNDPLFITAAIASFIVLAILIVGVGAFAKGGEFNRRYANKLMRLRLLAQFIAVILIVAFAYLGSRS
jgi:hypothetical protein|tara:strand:+ start:1071 stop:1277 length:207 start_codon:yes stop_codon:yes gene_type:complete